MSCSRELPTSSHSAIVLATLNAKYIHASFGLRYLLANLEELASRATIKEFDIGQRPVDIVERILALNPKIVGFGVYIWNAVETLEVVSLLKKIRPEITVVLGGPEVSYETESQAISALADHVVCGEADHAFRQLCRDLFAGKQNPKIITAAVPACESLKSPYHLYNDDDIAHRVVYVEASRGCPFTCEFCLSSLEIPLRQFETSAFLRDLEILWNRGLRQFKFVDRTFNLNLQISKTILEFFLARASQGVFAHFEMVPDRLPEALREVIAKFPPGTLQFEVGIQSFNPEVGKLISRRQNFEKIAENLKFLRQVGVYVHADLIAGLPGESLESFAAGFDRLIELDPNEIQVGILKRLRGTPIVRHDAAWEMVYSPHPPYEILRTKLVDFPTMQRLQRFSRYWDLVANSGRFVASKSLLWKVSGKPFDSFLRFSDWLFARTGLRHGISVKNLAAFLYEFLVAEAGIDADTAGVTIMNDLRRCGILDFHPLLRRFADQGAADSAPRALHLPARQGRHLSSTESPLKAAND